MNNFELVNAAEHGKLGTVRDCISESVKAANPAMLDVVLNGKRSALTGASRYGHWQVIKDLLAAGANVEIAVGSNGMKPLMVACSYGYSKAVTELLEGKADINAVDKWGNTALYHAAQWGYSNTILILLERGVNWEHRNQNGRTAVEELEHNEYIERATYLYVMQMITLAKGDSFMEAASQHQKAQRYDVIWDSIEYFYQHLGELPLSLSLEKIFECYKLIPATSDHYSEANNRLAHMTLKISAIFNGKSQDFSGRNPELLKTRLRFALAGGENAQMIADETYHALCGRTGPPVFTGIKGDADTLIAQAAGIRRLEFAILTPEDLEVANMLCTMFNKRKRIDDTQPDNSKIAHIESP